jgi:phytanoyl-CoA hydroxylase
MVDKRATSTWVGMDDTTLDNGCIWFVPESQHKILDHKHATEGKHVLVCIEDVQSRGVPCPIPAGGCHIHAGGALHYAGPNKSDHTRRGFITVQRPQKMVDWEREHGFTHGKEGLCDIHQNHGSIEFQ